MPAQSNVVVVCPFLQLGKPVMVFGGLLKGVICVRHSVLSGEKNVSCTYDFIFWSHPGIRKACESPGRQFAVPQVVSSGQPSKNDRSGMQELRPRTSIGRDKPRVPRFGQPR